MKNIFYFKAWKFDLRDGYFWLRDVKVECKTVNEFYELCDEFLKEHDMNKQEREIYLRSAYWKTLKLKVYKAHGRKCMICGTKRNQRTFTVHHAKGHSSYGKEEFNDLRIVCLKCHDHLHWILSKTQDKIDVPKFCNNLKRELHINGYY